VHFSPTRVTLGGDVPDAGSGTRLTLTVACGPAGGSGEVEIVVPDGLAVTVADSAPDPGSSPGGGAGGDRGLDTRGAATGGPLRYDLEPHGFASWNVTVSALTGAADGRYFLTARIADELGQLLEDTALVTIGEPGGPDPDLEPEENFFRMQSDVMALADEVDLELLTPEVRLAPGMSGELSVRLASHLASQLRGEVQLISPIGTWEAAGPWTQGVSVPPGGEATVRFDVTVPATASPGWESWLLVKLMYFGRVRYSEAVPLTVVH
jgi:hypothetical protein